jgi:hypothetical protein
MDSVQIQMKREFTHRFVKVTQTLSVNRVLVKHFWTLLQAHRQADRQACRHRHTHMCEHTFPGLFYVVLLLTLFLWARNISVEKMQMAFSVSR